MSLSVVKTPANKLASCASYRKRMMQDPEKAALYRARQKVDREKRKADPVKSEKEKAYRREYKSKNKDKIAKLNADRQKRLGTVIYLRRKGLPDSLLPTVKSALKCEICGGNPDGRWRKLVIDHCHTTGNYRGMLCNNCNHGLGKFKDQPELLRQAATYLEKFRKTLANEFVAG